MGRASTKENKSIYQITREELKLTREKASEMTGFMSAEHIEKIENGKISIQPDDVMALSECYKAPKLCNYYCSNECEIGRQYVPEIQIKDLAQIVLEMLASLNSIEKRRERMIEITADGKIEKDEVEDFVRIQEDLERISVTVETLQLWAEQKVAAGEIDLEAYNAIKQKSE